MSEHPFTSAGADSPLDTLHAAVQAFSNALAEDDPDDAGVVTAALVVWEETSFDPETGKPRHAVLYAATGDGGGRPSVALGLATNVHLTLGRDVLGPAKHA